MATSPAPMRPRSGPPEGGFCEVTALTAMTAKAARVHQRTCSVEVSPNEVDAGGELTVVVRVSCPEGCDLQGQRVSIRDEDDAELAEVELAELIEVEGDACATVAITLQAPRDAGEHIWRAVLAAIERDGVLHEETATAFAFSTQAHAASVNVWGVPSAIPVGEAFSFNVGIKCSAGCKLAGRQVAVFDHEGAPVAAGHLREDAWPDTSALYFVELRAKAPREQGDYRWRVETPGSETGMPHAAGSSTLAVKVVPAAGHEVTVEAFDAESGAPIKGAHVLLHPYRALTDDSGVAKVRVAMGTYRLFVSGFNYIAYENLIDVASNMAIRAELSVEPEGQEDYR
jgi:hypothetical protein